MNEVLVVADRVRTASGIAGDAVHIRAGRVVAVGRAEDLRRPGLAEDRYRGSTIVPGLGDGHFHPLGHAASVVRLNVAGAADFDALAERVRTSASRTPPNRPLIGVRLDEEGMAEGRLPTRTDLDAMLPGRSILLYRYCGHIAVASTAALEEAGVAPDTADPVGGSFDREMDGRPNGILRETAAAVVGDALGGRTGDLEPDELLAALRSLVALGITRLCAMVSMGSDTFCGIRNELETLLAVADDLPLFVTAFVIAPSADELASAAERIERAGRRLSFGGVKDFTDGSLGGHTAAMRSPYSDDPSTTGTLRFDEPHLRSLAERSLELGGEVAFHAIGDHAVGETLRLFGDLVERGVAPRRLRIEHASVMADEDVANMAALGVRASVQPAFLASETTWLHKRLGGRVAEAYRFRSMIDAGIPLLGGSDCPVEPPSPLWGMAVARDRAGIEPTEGLSASEALGLFTDAVSQAAGVDAPLSAGAPANLTLLDLDPVEAEAASVRNAEVVSTWIDGEPQVFDSSTPSWVG